ncbi:MAG: PepSY domain-containing protein [Burkholderiales bacterium]|nr:PepSY domain-containing protein [Nitrosomonas sp.]MCP5276543.1 PepSY domain-containing protein [Burkholderiales bacterium]
MNRLQKFLITFLITSLPVNVMAERHDLTENLYKTGNQQANISQQKAISIAQRHIKGRVLDIRRSDNIYRIKILSDQGSIHVVKVSAIDGKIKTGH